MENNHSKALTAGVYLLRGACIFAIFFFMRLIIFIMTMNVALDKNTQIFAEFPLWSVGLIVLVGSLFLYNSVIRHLSLYDKHSRDEFLEHLEVGGRLAEYKRIITSGKFICETGASLLLASLFVPFGIFTEAEYLFGFAGSLRFIFIYAVYFAAFIFSGVNAKYETHRHWKQLYETRDIDSLDSRWKFALKGILILMIYPFAVPLSPVLVFLAINVFTVLRAVMGLFSTVGLIITIVFLLFLILAMPKLKVLRVRRKFIKQLKITAERADYELSDIRNEKSLKLGCAGGLTFSIKDRDKTYSCRLIPIEKKGLPLYFTSAINAYFLYKIGFKKHFVSLAKHFEYGFEGEGKHIVILAPEPKYVFVSSDGGERRLYTGDKMWQHYVFEGESFFGAMDRHCLDKSNGMFE